MNYVYLTLVWILVLIPEVTCAAAPSNNAFSAAQEIFGRNGSTTGTVRGATKQSGEFAFGSSTVWYVWTAPVTAATRFSIRNEGLVFLDVFTGSTLGTLSPQSSGLFSPTFLAVAGRTYRIQVYGISANDAQADEFILSWVSNPMGILSFEKSNYSVNEYTTSLTVNVVRRGGAQGAQTFRVTSRDSVGAVAGRDYAPLSQELTMLNGETSKAVTVTIINDSVKESGGSFGAELFRLEIEVPSGGAFGDGETSGVAIFDDDGAKSIFSFESDVSNTPENGNHTITVRRGGNTSGIATINFSLGSESAKEGSDFTDVADSLTFAAGELTKNITIPIIDDTKDEVDEVFFVFISSFASNGERVQLGAIPLHRVVITDNDPTPDNPGMIAFFKDGDLDFEGFVFDENEIRLTRTGGSTGVVSAQLEVGNAIGSATLNQDFFVSTLNVTFQNGEQTKSIFLEIVDDSLREGEETITLRLISPTGGATVDSTADTHRFRILDDEPDPPASAIKVAYTGVMNLDQTNPGTGIIFVQISSDRKLTGKMLVNGETFSFKGAFNNDGIFSKEFTTNIDGETVSMPLLIELIDDGEQLTGSFTDAQGIVIAYTARRHVVGSKRLPVAEVGHYTGLFRGADIGGAAEVRGVFSLRVSPTGKAKVIGVLPDGTKISYGTNLVTDGHVPVSISLYSKTLGYLIGDPKVDTAEASFVGDFTWRKELNTKPPFITVQGATLMGDGLLYTAPARGQRAVAGFDGNSGAARVDLTGGGLAASILGKAITIDTRNKVTIAEPATDKLALAISPSRGLVSGKFTDTTGQRRSISGIIVQTEPIGTIEGFFSGIDTTGVVKIAPALIP